jgi:hypothetical protein
MQKGLAIGVHNIRSDIEQSLTLSAPEVPGTKKPNGLLCTYSLYRFVMFFSSSVFEVFAR